MSEEKQLAVSTAEQPFVRASTALSQQLGLEPRALIDAIKTQFFKGKEATDAQLAVVVSTARELGLNPLIPGQLYPYPDRSGAVTIMLGPDGIYTLLANNKDVVAQKDGGAAYWTEHAMDNGKETCTGFINHRTKGLLKKTIWVDEWVVSSNPNWQSRRHHMSEIRALKQAARMVIHGIPNDVDEQRIGEMLNVTPETEAAPAVERPAPKPRSPKGASVVKNNEPKVVDAVVEDVQTAPVAAPVATPEPAPAPAPEPAPAKVESFADAAASTEAEQPKAPEPITQRAMLADGVTLTVVAKVEKIEVIVGKREGKDYPYVTAMVDSPEFRGQVSQTDGGMSEGSPIPAWIVGKVVTLKLRGKRYKSGTLATIVDSIEEASGETSATDGEV